MTILGDGGDPALGGTNIGAQAIAPRRGPEMVALLSNARLSTKKGGIEGTVGAGLNPSGGDLRYGLPLGPANE